MWFVTDGTLTAGKIRLIDKGRVIPTKN